MESCGLFDVFSAGDETGLTDSVTEFTIGTSGIALAATIVCTSSFSPLLFFGGDFIDILKYNGASRIFIKIPFYIESIIYSIIGSSLSFFFVKYFFITFNSYFDLNIKMDDYLWLWIIGFSIFIGLYSSNQSMKRNLNE